MKYLALFIGVYALCMLMSCTNAIHISTESKNNKSVSLDSLGERLLFDILQRLERDDKQQNKDTFSSEDNMWKEKTFEARVVSTK